MYLSVLPQIDVTGEGIPHHYSWSSEFQITVDRAIDRNCPQLGVK